MTPTSPVELVRASDRLLDSIFSQNAHGEMRRLERDAQFQALHDAAVADPDRWRGRESAALQHLLNLPSNVLRALADARTLDLSRCHLRALPAEIGTFCSQLRIAQPRRGAGYVDRQPLDIAARNDRPPAQSYSALGGQQQSHVAAAFSRAMHAAQNALGLEQQRELRASRARKR